jgi:hypothetical protein
MNGTNANTKEPQSVVFSSDGWDGAISEAERQIADAAERVRRLRRSVRTFRTLKDSGEPFPGQEAVLGQDSDL